MFGSTILDTIVGLVFVYLVVSLVVTAATELIAAWLGWRANKLWAGIRNLLSSEGAEDWARKLYDHALIRGLSPPASKGTLARKIGLALAPNGPSYIPAHTFSVTLLDLVHNADPTFIGVRNSLRELLERIPSSTSSTSEVKKDVLSFVDAIPARNSLVDRVKTDLQVLVNNIPDIDLAVDKLRQELQVIANKIPSLDSTRASLKRDLQNLVTQPVPLGYSAVSLKNDIQELIKNVPYSASTAQLVKKDIQELINRVPESADSTASAKAIIRVFADKMLEKYFADIIAQIPNLKLQSTVSALFEESGRDLGKLKETIETWFNDAMDRVSGWYKRQTQMANLLLGIAFTFALNLDSVLIVKILSGNSSGLRESLVTAAQKFVEHPTVAFKAPTSPPPSASVSPTANQQATDFRLLKAQFDELTLPIGWTPGTNTDTENLVAAEVDAAQVAQKNPGRTTARLGNPDFREWPGWTWQEKGLGEWLRNWRDTIHYHFIGWVLTTIAVSLGAPFWFDLLNRIVAIRSTGNVPEEQRKSPQQNA